MSDFQPSGSRIAFVGTGRMGANMARRLLERKFALTAVYDVHRPAAEALASELGVWAPPTLAHVTAAADVIFTVVSDDAAQRGIFAASGDSLLVGATGRTFVNCATLSPSLHRELEAPVRAAGARQMEACMASSIPQAREGTLYLICSGDEGAYADTAPLLDALSSSRRWVGGAGRAAEVKALVNMLMNINTAGLAEALGLGAALGLDLAALSDVFAHTGANARVLGTDGPDMIAREHDVYFSAAHARKDSGIALGLARQAGLTLPLAEATYAQYDALVARGFGELDKSAIAELTFPGRGTPA